VRRILPALAWLILIYVVTVLSEGFAPPPTEFWARVLFELKHVAAHSFVYGVQAVLIEAGLRRAAPESLDRPSARPVVALIIALGLGQEVLQSLLRHKVTVIGSAFDLATDGTAAALAIWAWWSLLARGFLPPLFPRRSQKP
jgi:hypothetical protein